MAGRIACNGNVVLAKLLIAVTALAVTNPFELMSPCVSLSRRDHHALGRGEVVARTLPAHEGQVAIFAMTKIDAPPIKLVESTRAIADLKKSSFVTAIARFSDPPVLSDLNQLVLPPRDIEALRQCRPGQCSFKLTTPEIESLVKARTEARGEGDAVQRAFRRVLLGRVNTYLSGGLGGLPAVANRARPHELDDTMAALEAQTPCLAQLPPLADWLKNGSARRRDVESFLYWSQESYGSGKPVVVVTHVAILNDSPDRAIVIGKQIFSSRYMDGALALTAITTDGSDGSRYLIYLNRSAVDLLGGFFSGFKRSILESRLKGEVPEIIQRLRGRLERPPS